jgi:hypothetical protein
MEREMMRKMLAVLKTLRAEYPGAYRRYLMLPKKERVVVIEGFLTSESIEDVRTVIMDIFVKYDKVIMKIRKKLAA